MRQFLVPALASALLGLGLSACGSGSSSTSAPQSGLPQTISESQTISASTLSTRVNWQVQAGASTLDQAFQDLDFYANAITIDAGDTVTWRIASKEPHTVAFLLPGQPFPADGSPQQVAPAGGTVVDGSRFVNSGILNGGQTVTFTFPKAGTYKYYCLLHDPEMTGTVVVQKAGAPYPHTQAYYTHVGTEDEWVDLNAAGTSLSRFPFTPDSTRIAAGISPPFSGGLPAQSTVLRYLTDSSRDLNNSVVINTGTTLTWKNLSNNEPHTITLPIAGQPLPNVPPFIPPAGGTTYDGSTFTNSGIIPPGGSYSLKFTKHGSYTVYCLFHFPEGMIEHVHVL